MNPLRNEAIEEEEEEEEEKQKKEDEQSTTAYLGVDQTGAVIQRRGGKVYRPLPAVVALPGKNRTVQILATSRHQKKLGLVSFDQTEILGLIESCASERRNIVVLADCVFGLPSDMRRGDASLRQLLDHAATHDSTTSEPLGRKRSSAFFRKILEEFRRDGFKDKKWPLRLCEQLASSNSVFQEHPFQKNIQSGTYRIWCDLGRSHGNQKDAVLRFWPHDFTTGPESNKVVADRIITVAEGYPSLYWRNDFGAKTRRPEALKALATAALKDLGWSLQCAPWE